MTCKQATGWHEHGRFTWPKAHKQHACMPHHIYYQPQTAMPQLKLCSKRICSSPRGPYVITGKMYQIKQNGQNEQNEKTCTYNAPLSIQVQSGYFYTLRLKARKSFTFDRFASTCNAQCVFNVPLRLIRCQSNLTSVNEGFRAAHRAPPAVVLQGWSGNERHRAVRPETHPPTPYQD
jgi:hypothetical protein